MILFGKIEVIGDLDGEVTVAEAPLEWVEGRMWVRKWRQ